MTEETKKQDNFLQLKDITTTFGSIVALNNVNFSVKKGEVVCLIGPSGCGKSTLLRTANWLTPPDKGSVSLDGVIVGSESNKNMSLNEMKVLNGIRAKMGMVFQQFNVWPHLDALENVVRAQLVVAKRSRKDAEQKLNLENMKAMMNQDVQETKIDQNEELAELRADTSIEKQEMANANRIKLAKMKPKGGQ